MSKIKVLNLYAGIGGNRKLWGDDLVEVTAVELDEQIANIYKDIFPQDNVIIGDAHQFLLEHFKEFDFIWTSPPCTTHSTMAKLCGRSNDFGRGNHKKKPQFPDMKLYEEILFLQHYFDGIWVVENVRSFYEPLIKPQVLQRHFFWSNFTIPQKKFESDNIKWGKIAEWQKKKGYDLSSYKGLDKRKVLRNCVHSELGLHIFESAYKEREQKLLSVSHKSHTLASPTFPTEKAINKDYQETSEEVSQIPNGTSDNPNNIKLNFVRGLTRC
jgi:DNA (cytosine-5)-methyltransferase 1